MKIFFSFVVLTSLSSLTFSNETFCKSKTLIISQQECKTVNQTKETMEAIEKEVKKLSDLYKEAKKCSFQLLCYKLAYEVQKHQENAFSLIGVLMKARYWQAITHLRHEKLLARTLFQDRESRAYDALSSSQLKEITISLVRAREMRPSSEKVVKKWLKKTVEITAGMQVVYRINEAFESFSLNSLCQPLSGAVGHEETYAQRQARQKYIDYIEELICELRRLSKLQPPRANNKARCD